MVTSVALTPNKALKRDKPNAAHLACPLALRYAEYVINSAFNNCPIRQVHMNPVSYMLSGFIIIASIPLSGCNDDLKTRVEQLTKDNDRLKVNNINLYNELTAANNQLAKLRQIIETRAVLKPPITVHYRNALMGHGLVAIINTHTKDPITILVTWRSGATDAVKRTQIHLDGKNEVELGHLEGFPLEQGDTLTIHNNEYEPVTVKVKLN
jgi:hypothetical protein